MDLATNAPFSAATQDPVIDNVGSHLTTDTSFDSTAAQELSDRLDETFVTVHVGDDLLIPSCDEPAEPAGAHFTTYASSDGTAGDDSPITSCHQDATVTEPAGAVLANTTSEGAAAEPAVKQHAGTVSNTNTSSDGTAAQPAATQRGAGTSSDWDTAMTEPVRSTSTPPGPATQVAVAEHAEDESTNTPFEDTAMTEPADSTTSSDETAAHVAMTEPTGADLTKTSDKTVIAIKDVGSGAESTNLLDEADIQATGADTMATSADGNGDGAGRTNAASNDSQAGAHPTNLPTSRQARETAGMESNSQPETWDLAYEDTLPLPKKDAGISANKSITKPDITVDLTDLSDTDRDDDGDTASGRPSRESKVRGSQQQARDSHVALTMKALDDLGVQVLHRAGVKGEKRPLSDFLEVEKAATEKTVTSLKELLIDVKRYGDSLKKARV
jgi:hypothetical protein